MNAKDLFSAADKSVLCWLATVNHRNEPNVTPKEMFSVVDESRLIIANIASPNSIENIRQNPNVCVSFIDIFTQKGCKINGKASIYNPDHELYAINAKVLVAKYSDVYEIKSIISVSILSVASITAPSYFKFPNKTEESQISDAMKTYGVKPA